MPQEAKAANLCIVSSIDGYVTGTKYTFDPPIEVDSRPFLQGSKEWAKRYFASGVCIGYDLRHDAFKFKGRYVVKGKSRPFVFLVEHGRKNKSYLERRALFHVVK